MGLASSWCVVSSCGTPYDGDFYSVTFDVEHLELPPPGSGVAPEWVLLWRWEGFFFVQRCTSPQTAQAGESGDHL